MQHSVTSDSKIRDVVLSPAKFPAVSLTISKVIQLGAAFILGAVIIYAAGFVQTSVAHNAAHDTRHSTGFPCH